jgi:peroxiredoxin 1
MSSGNAKIGHPALNLKATAVMPGGQFKEITFLATKEMCMFFFALLTVPLCAL